MPVLTRANVTVLDKDTGESRTTESNSEGLYSVAALKPGNYTITLAAPGFKTQVYDPIVVHVGQELKLDCTLLVGRVQESVTGFWRSPPF